MRRPLLSTLALATSLTPLLGCGAAFDGVVSSDGAGRIATASVAEAEALATGGRALEPRAAPGDRVVAPRARAETSSPTTPMVAALDADDADIETGSLPEIARHLAPRSFVRRLSDAVVDAIDTVVDEIVVGVEAQRSGWRVAEASSALPESAVAEAPPADAPAETPSQAPAETPADAALDADALLDESAVPSEAARLFAEGDAAALPTADAGAAAAAPSLDAAPAPSPTAIVTEPKPAPAPRTPIPLGWAAALAAAPASDAAAPLPTADVLPPPPVADWRLEPIDPVRLLEGDPLADLAARAAQEQAARAAERQDTSRLDVADLVAKMLRENPDVRIAAARAEVAEADLDVARAALGPSLDFEAVLSAKREREMSDLRHEDTTQSELALIGRQRLYDFGASDAEIERTAEVWLQQRETTKAKAEEIVGELLDTIVGVMQVDATRAATQRNIESLARIDALVIASEAGGAATAADVQRVRSRLDAAKTSLIQIESQRESAVNAVERLAQVSLERLDVGSLAQYLEGAGAFELAELERNPEIAALRREVRALENQYRATARGYWPTLDLETVGGYSAQQEDNSDETVNGSISLVFKMPLFDSGRNAALRRQSLAQVREARLRLAKRERELLEEAQNSTTFDRTDDEKSEVLAARVTSLETVADLALEQFAGGQRTVFELLESEADLAAARIEEITHRHDRMRTRLTRMRLGGRLVEAFVEAPVEALVSGPDEALSAAPAEAVVAAEDARAEAAGAPF